MEFIVVIPVQLLLLISGHNNLFAFNTASFVHLFAPWHARVVHQISGPVNGYFQHVQFTVLFITLLCFARKSHDKSTVLERNLVFGPCIALVSSGVYLLLCDLIHRPVSVRKYPTALVSGPTVAIAWTSAPAQL